MEGGEMPRLYTRDGKGRFQKGFNGVKPVGPGLLPPRPSGFEGRDARTMSDDEKIRAYTHMHGKPPSAAMLKKMGRKKRL
jgi:hypothetical protein